MDVNPYKAPDCDEEKPKDSRWLRWLINAAVLIVAVPIVAFMTLILVGTLLSFLVDGR